MRKMGVSFLRLILFILLISINCHKRSHAQWSHNPEADTRVLLGSFFNGLVSDGSGGVIIIGRKNYLYTAQKVDGDGYIVWDPSRQGLTVIVPDSINDVTIGPNTYLKPDGKGGVYIAYDYYDFLGILTDPERVILYDLDTHVQHLDDRGRRTWGNKGVPLSTLKGTNPDYYYIGSSRIMALGGDGHGGIVAVWEWSDHDVIGNEITSTYIQRVDSSGHLLWEENGRKVSDGDAVKAMVDEEGSPFAITYRRNGGAITTYLIKADVEGQLLWEKQLSSFSVDNIVGILSDGSGGAYILGYCYDHADPEKRDIIAQRFDKDGNELWGEGGIVVCDDIGSQGFLQSAIQFGDSNFIVAWCDARRANAVYLQRVDSNGTLMWGDHGIPVSLIGSFVYCELLETSDKEIIATFHDRRDSLGITYAQKFNENSEAQWESNDVLISTRTYPGRLISDGRGGAIIGSGQAGPDRGVYIYRVDKTGNLGGIDSVDEPQNDDSPSHFNLRQNQPNPFTNQTTIQYTIKHGQHAVQLKVLNILGEEVVTLVNEVQGEGTYAVPWSGVNNHGVAVAAGVYLYKLQVGHFHLVKKLVVFK